jgi:hypothetical protein
MVWAYLGIIAVAVGFFIFLYRSGYKNGYKQGKEDADNAWQKKVTGFIDRVSDHDDHGISVSEPGVHWGEAPGAEVRLEPAGKDESK